jgi:MarR family transcriptional regulator, organic hydroperoxide resistance regulator
MRREETIDHNIKTTWHAIARMYNQQAGKYDLTMAMGFVLLNIDLEGTPATKIAPLIGLESRSLTRLLKSMEEKKLVYRKADKNDKRSVRIFLTEQGKNKKERSREVVLKFNNTIRKQISADKLENFFEVLQSINQIIEKSSLEFKADQ